MDNHLAQPDSSLLLAGMPPAPRAGSSPSPRAAPLETRTAPTILLVEDQGDVRLLARLVLERGGFKVIAAADAEEAQQAAGSLGIHRLDALVTDVVMPGPSGPALAAALRRLRPDLPVLFLSGYDEEMVREARHLGEGEAFLAKPFSPDALIRSVRALVGPPEPEGAG